MNMNKVCYICKERAIYLCKNDNAFLCDKNEHVSKHIDDNYELSYHEIVDVNDSEMKLTRAEEDEKTLAESGLNLNCMDLPVTSLALSGEYLYVASKNDIHKFNLANDECMWKAQTSTIIWSIQASNDGTLLASALNSGVVCLFSQSTGEEQTTLTPPSEGPATKVIFTENSSNIITSSSSGNVTVYNSSSKNTQISKKVHESAILTLASTYNSKSVFSGSIMGEIHACNISTGDIKQLAKRHNKPVTALACTQSGTLVSASADGSVLTWNSENFSFLKELCTFHCRFFSLAINQATSEIFVSDSNMEIKVIHLESKKTVRKRKVEQGIVSELVFNKQNNMIYGITNDMAVMAFDSRNLTYKGTVGNSNLVSAMMTLDNQYLVCSFNNGWVKFYNLITSKIDHDLFYTNGKEVFSKYPELGIVIEETN